MKQKAIIGAIESHVSQIEKLSQVKGLLLWDQETNMPAGATSQRAEQCAALEEILHSKWTDPGLIGWLADVDRSVLDERQSALVRVAKFEVDRKRKISVELAAEIARLIPISQQVWSDARKTGEFAQFKDVLSQVVALQRQQANALANGSEPYDALLAEFEPGMTARKIESMFTELRPGLVKLLAAIKESGSVCPRLDGNFPHDRQLVLAKELASSFGYDWDRGRLDQSTHPFTAGAFNDVRITTRLAQDTPLDCIYSTIHETGHAIYEQGVDQTLGLTILGSGASMGIHESQSRLMENQIGRGRPFCEYLFARMRDSFGNLGVNSASELYAAVNSVLPGFIRTEADEVQYNLHIMLRFDLERALMSGDLEVADLEAAWNDRFFADFGFEVDNASNGVLQDIHWSAGMFGYFPTYTLGNIYSAELYTCIREDLPNLDEDLVSGDTSALVGWLRERIHRYGRKTEPVPLMVQVAGHEPSGARLLSYLNEKFGELYEL